MLCARGLDELAEQARAQEASAGVVKPVTLFIRMEFARALEISAIVARRRQSVQGRNVPPHDVKPVGGSTA
jgi:hypothetical protein